MADKEGLTSLQKLQESYLDILYYVPSSIKRLHREEIEEINGLIEIFCNDDVDQTVIDKFKKQYHSDEDSFCFEDEIFN